MENQREANGADWVLKGYLRTDAIIEEARIGGVPEYAEGELAEEN